MNTHPLIAWMQAVNDTLVDHLDRGDRRLVELGQQLTAFAATQAPAVTPDRCPTCGSADKNKASRMEGGTKEWCYDSFHDTSNAATPAPEPWRPDYEIGDKVKDVQSGRDGEIVEIDREGRKYLNRTSPSQFSRWCQEVDLRLIERGIRYLTALCGGDEPHRVDGWQQDWLPPGMRPLCKGELPKKGDEIHADFSAAKAWTTVHEDRREDGLPSTLNGFFYRTTRPAPSQAQAEPVPEPPSDIAPDSKADGDKAFRDHIASERKRLAEPTAQTAGEAAYARHQQSHGEANMWDVLYPAAKAKWENVAQAAIAFAQSSRTEEAGKAGAQAIQRSFDHRGDTIDRLKRELV